jgi:general secretion pathway protein D
MHTLPFIRQRNAILLIATYAVFTGATGLFSINSWAQTASVAAAAAPAGGVKRGDPITLNFTNAEIDAVARTMATLTGRNVVVDPRVKGTITLTTDKPVSPAQAYSQFLAMLRLQGFTVVDAAGLDKIVPEADAKLQGGAVFDSPQVTGSQIATQIF